MLTRVARCGSPLAAIVFATVLAQSICADEHDIRIGRYQSVRIDAPHEEIAASVGAGLTAIPEEIVTRNEALQWMLAQHGYQLYGDTQRLLTLATLPSAPIPAGSHERLSGTLHVELGELLGPTIDILVDPESKRVALFISEEGLDAERENSDAE